MSDGQLVLFKSLKYKIAPKIEAPKKTKSEKWLLCMEKVTENYQIFVQRSNSTKNAKF